MDNCAIEQRDVKPQERTPRAHPGWAALLVVHYFGRDDDGATFLLRDVNDDMNDPVKTRILGINPGISGLLGICLVVANW